MPTSLAFMAAVALPRDEHTAADLRRLAAALDREFAVPDQGELYAGS